MILLRCRWNYPSAARSNTSSPGTIWKIVQRKMNQIISVISDLMWSINKMNVFAALTTCFFQPFLILLNYRVLQLSWNCCFIFALLWMNFAGTYWCTDDTVLSLLPGPHEASVSQGGDQRLLQTQQQVSRSGQPPQSSPMSFQGQPISQHGALIPNQTLAPTTQNAQTQHTHLPPHHLQSTPPPPNQASHPWATLPTASNPLSSPPVTPQKVPHIQVSLHQTVALMWLKCSVRVWEKIKTICICFHLRVYFMWMFIFHVGGVICVWRVREVCSVCVHDIWEHSGALGTGSVGFYVCVCICSCVCVSSLLCLLLLALCVSVSVDVCGEMDFCSCLFPETRAQYTHELTRAHTEAPPA